MARIRSFRRARPTHLIAGLTLISSLVVPALGGAPARAASPSGTGTPSTAHGDFNRDGYADLAVGVPLEDLNTFAEGAVHIIYGSARGLNAVEGVLPAQFLTQTDAEGPEMNDGFGMSLAVGDFNGDGFGDLAAGANGEDVGAGAGNEGSITVFYGSPSGLVPGSAQYITEATPTTGNQLGFFMVGGDFNGDGRDDLAVDVPYKNVGGQVGAGAVLLFRGGAAGLDAAHPYQLSEDSPGTEDKAELNDGFGNALAAGDVNGDGRADLAVGVPYETVNGRANAGAVHLFFGCSSGSDCHLVNTSSDQYLVQGQNGVKNSADPGDFFGTSVVIGDFGKSKNADLAVGISGEDVKGAANAGAVAIFYGTATGLTMDGNQFFTQGAGGVNDTAEAGDEFGAILAAGNLGKDAHADLVITVPLEDVGTVADAGAVAVLYGGVDGLTPEGNAFITQDTSGVPGKAGVLHVFGKMAVVANFGRSAEVDLAVASRDDVNGVATAGAVTVLYGNKDTGVGGGGFQYWTQDSPGIQDSAEPNDLFGGVYGQPGIAG